MTNNAQPIFILKEEPSSKTVLLHKKEIGKFTYLSNIVHYQTIFL